MEKALDIWFDPKAEPFDVTLLLDSNAIVYFERKPIKGQYMKKNSDGTAELTISITNKEEIFTVLKKWLPQIRVIEPHKLQEEFEEMMREYLAGKQNPNQILTFHSILTIIDNILYKRIFMQVVNYSHARNNLKSIIDDVCNNNEEVIITTKNDKSVIILSMDEYNRTHAEIKKDVQISLEQIERGEYMDIEEAFKLAKQSYRD